MVEAECSVGRGPRNLHISRLRLTPKARSFRCSSSPHENRSAGFSWGPRNFRLSATRIGVAGLGKDWKDQRLMSLPLAWSARAAAAGLVAESLSSTSPVLYLLPQMRGSKGRCRHRPLRSTRYSAPGRRHPGPGGTPNQQLPFVQPCPVGTRLDTSAFLFHRARRLFFGRNPKKSGGAFPCRKAAHPPFPPYGRKFLQNHSDFSRLFVCKKIYFNHGQKVR